MRARVINLAFDGGYRFEHIPLLPVRREARSPLATQKAPFETDGRGLTLQIRFRQISVGIL